MWGSLTPGPYGVGFQRHFVHDHSRTWKLTGSGDFPFKADLVGRPIEFNTWYPAAASNHHRAMSLADYYPKSAPPGFALLNRVMETRADWNDTARSTPMAAISNAPPIVGSFPVVLMFGGLGDDINANVVMAEYLASHGMLVVSVSLLGASEEATDPSTDSQGVETTVRDMEYVLSIVDRYANVDPSRVAAVGHSFGGVEAALLAIRNGNVSAVVGLDATYGFKGMSGSVTEAAGHSADRFRAAFLDIRRAEGIGGAELDLTVLESLHYAERWQVTLPIQHEDFTSRAESGRLLFQGSDVPLVVENGKAGYEFVCELLSHFLAHHFSGPGAADYDIEAAAHAVQAGYRHWVAETPPMTPWQIWATTIPKGPDAIRARLSEQCGGEDLETCTAINGLAAVGDELGSRGQLRDALVVSQTVAWARPRSVFAQDQLANGYIALGDVDSYRKALERAIELIPIDPTLKSETKPSFEQMERDKLDRLPP
jgi:pimeloyl-ACP methyl ester carboxylesterase